MTWCNENMFRNTMILIKIYSKYKIDTNEQPYTQEIK